MSQSPLPQAPPPGFAPPQPKPGTDGFAITALVFGLLGGWLAFVFGPIALSRIKKSGRGGRGMAITGMVVAAAWISIIVAAVFASQT